MPETQPAPGGSTVGLARLREALDRIYWLLPAGNAATDVEVSILAVYRDMGLEPDV